MLFVIAALFSSLLGLPARLLSLVLVIRTTPFSPGVTSTVFALARPLYFQALREVTLFGSIVNSAPRLPIPLRPDFCCFRMKHEVSRTAPQISSGEQFAMRKEGRGRSLE